MEIFYHLQGVLDVPYTTLTADKTAFVNRWPMVSHINDFLDSDVIGFQSVPLSGNFVQRFIASGCFTITDDGTGSSATITPVESDFYGVFHNTDIAGTLAAGPNDTTHVDVLFTAQAPINPTELIMFYKAFRDFMQLFLSMLQSNVQDPDYHNIIVPSKLPAP